MALVLEYWLVHFHQNSSAEIWYFCGGLVLDLQTDLIDLCSSVREQYSQSSYGGQQPLLCLLTVSRMPKTFALRKFGTRIVVA